MFRKDGPLKKWDFRYMPRPDRSAILKSVKKKELCSSAETIGKDLIKNFVDDFLSDLLKEDIYHSRLHRVDEALFRVVQNISNCLDHGAGPEIRIEAVIMHFSISFRVFDPGETFDPENPPFLKNLDDAEYKLVKSCFNHIKYSRTGDLNRSEFIVRL